MDLDPVGTSWCVAGPNFVQAEHLACRVIELVVVDLNVGKSGVELHVYVALPGRELESRHLTALNGSSWYTRL